MTGPPVQLVVEFLPRFRLRAAEHEIAVRSKRAGALITYMALNDFRPERRERLAALLRSNVPEDAARALLRQTLHQLRRSLNGLGGRLLAADDDTVSFGPASTDLGSALDRLAAGDVPDAALRPTYWGRIGQEFEGVDPAFTAWLQAKRSAIEEDVTRHLERLAGDGRARLPTRRRAAEALLGLDPTHEPARRLLMRTLVADGQVARAVKLYNELWQLLEDEHDIEPSSETQALVARIKQGLPVEVGHPRPSVSPGEPRSVAAPAATVPLRLFVAEFENLLHGAERDHVARGLRQELMVSLARFREWVAIDALRLADAPVQSADYVLDGACLEAADGDVTLALRLAARASGEAVWADRFDAALSGWPIARSRVVHRMAAALKLAISADRVRRLLGKSETPLTTYDRWLKGMALTWQWRPEAATRAEELFRDAIAVEPTSPYGYAGLANLFNLRHLVRPGLWRAPDIAADSFEFARHAVELDPHDPRCRLIFAWSALMAGHFQRGELELEAATTLNECDSANLISAGLAYAFAGRHADASRLVANALALNPFPRTALWQYVAVVRFFSGDLAGAAEAGEIVQDEIQNAPGWRAAAYGLLGRRRQAGLAAEQFLDKTRATWCGDEAPPTETLVAWFLHAFPIRRTVDLDRLRQGLEAAGLPTGGRT